MDEVALSNLLGIAMRAGMVVSGDEMTEKAVRAGRVALVMLDAGVSDNTRQKYVAMCGNKRIPLCELQADTLGQSIGKSNRMIAAIKKGSLANKMVTLLT